MSDDDLINYKKSMALLSKSISGSANNLHGVDLHDSLVNQQLRSELAEYGANTRRVKNKRLVSCLTHHAPAGNSSIGNVYQHNEKSGLMTGGSLLAATAYPGIEAISYISEKPKEEVFREIRIELDHEFENDFKGPHYSLFDGLAYKVKTDVGELHKGTVSGGVIHIPKAKMNSRFELFLEDPPVFFE